MRWARVLVVLLVLGACAPDAGSWTTGTDRFVPVVPRNPDGASAEGSTRPVAVRRARAARPPAEAAPSTGDAAPADGREPPDPPPPPDPDEDAAAYVVGRVVDADGHPLPRAEVACFLGVSSEEGRTDADGRFRVGVDEPTGAVRVLAWARGWAVAVGDWRALAEGDTLDVGTIRLAPAAWIAGRVVDPSGAAVEAASVQVVSTDAFDAETWALLPRDVVRSVTCPARTEFEFGSLPAGRYVLAFSSGDGDRTADPVPVTAPDDDVTFVVSFETPPAAVVFETIVRVLEADGTALARGDWSLAVRAGSDEDLSRPYTILPWCEEAGTGLPVRIEVPELPCHLFVRAGQRAALVWSIGDVPGDEVVVRLPPVATGSMSISGTVAADGAPLTWERTGSRGCYSRYSGTPSHVSARRADRTGPVLGCDTSGDGTFRFSGLDDADYDVWVHASAPPWDDRALCPAETRVRAGAVGVVLDLPHGGTRRFEIRGPGGAKVDEIDECVTAIDEDAADAVESRSEGATVVASVLRPGATYRLTVRGRIGRTWTAWTHVEGWTAGEATIPVELDPGRTIRGRVVRADGSAVPAAYVFAEQGEDHADTYAALDGTFTLAGLAPGEWRVTAHAPALSNESEPVRLLAGTTGARIVVSRRE